MKVKKKILHFKIIMLLLLIITRSRRSWRKKGKVLEFPEGPRVHSSKLICAHCTNAAETLKHFLSSYNTILKERGNNFEEVKWLFKLLVPHPTPQNRLFRWSVTKKKHPQMMQDQSAPGWPQTSHHQGVPKNPKVRILECHLPKCFFWDTLLEML